MGTGNSAPAGGAPPGETSSPRPDKQSKIEQLERKEKQLWRISLLVLVLLAAALAFNSWEALLTLPERTMRDLAALPASVFAIIVIFAAYLWHKKREVAELHAEIRGMRASAEAPPTASQVERLLDVVSRSQMDFRNLVDGLEELVLNISLDGKIRAANRAVARTLGIPFREIVGHELAAFLEEAPDLLLKNVAAHVLDRRTWSGVIRLRAAATGNSCFLDCTFGPILDGREVVGISCLGRDITRERETEIRFTELFESLQEGVYFTTPDGKLLDANPTLVRMLGFSSKAELLQVNVQDLYVNPEDRSGLLAELNDKTAVREREIVLRRKDGSHLYCLDTSTACRDGKGRIIRYQGTLVDISQRREMEHRLHQEKEFARRLVDSLPDLVVVLDRQGSYTYVSPRISEVLGFEPEELLQQKLGERTHEDDQPTLLAVHRDLLEGKRVYATVEYRTLHKNGTWRIMRATACALRDAEGRITGVIATARDMTEVKRLEQQVTQSEKLAAMGQMIAGVAHELNNPLTAILGINDLLRERIADESARRQLELVQRQARRAAEIVQNLLTFARPPAPSRTRLNLFDLVMHTLQLHEYSLHVNHITIDVQPPADIAPEGMWVLGDSNQLMQVILNLIVNAEQAIHEVREHGQLRVRFGASDESGRNAVWVSFFNDGPPIPAEILPKIFDPFFTTKRPGRGTGLGLSICMAIVREHNGTIDARTFPEGGAEFRITLPLQTARNSLSPALLTPAALDTPAPGFSDSQRAISPPAENGNGTPVAAKESASLRGPCVE
jgi:two-component system NtrC family sensor kinase